MKPDELAELREKTAEELHERLSELYKDQFNFRMRQAAGQLSQTHNLGAVRKDIARVKTLLNEMGMQPVQHAAQQPARQPAQPEKGAQ